MNIFLKPEIFLQNNILSSKNCIIRNEFWKKRKKRFPHSDKGLKGIWLNSRTFGVSYATLFFTVYIMLGTRADVDVNVCNFQSIVFFTLFQSLVPFAALPDGYAHFIIVCQVSIQMCSHQQITCRGVVKLLSLHWKLPRKRHSTIEREPWYSSFLEVFILRNRLHPMFNVDFSIYSRWIDWEP